MEENNRRKISNYLLGSELAFLVRERPRSLTLVFDQSLPNGKGEFRRQELDEKVRDLANQHAVSSFAYLSHACFIIAGCDATLVNRAREHVIAESRLPVDRLSPVVSTPKAAHAWLSTNC